MKKKIKLYFGVFFLLLIAGGYINAKPCLAASAEIEITSDTTTVIVGDNLFVYLQIKSDSLFGDFEANLTYDDTILEYMGGASVVTGSSGYLKISDMGHTDGSNSRKYTLKFEAIKAGSCKISLSGRAMVYNYDSGIEMSVSSNVLTMLVKAPDTASGNASLKSLKTSPYELVPAFNREVFVYSAKVDYGTERLIITALPEDEKATVSIIGNDSLKEGENKVGIKVLSESGDVIEYTINVFREFAPEEATQVEEDLIEIGTSHGKFEVVMQDGVEYAVYSGKFKLIEPDSEVKIPEGYVKTKLIISDISITAYSPEDDLEGEFLLIYAVNELGDEGFYQYDRIEKTLQRYVMEGTGGYNNIDPSDANEIMKSQEYKSNLNMAAVVIALLSVICLFLVFIMVRLFLRLKGLKEDEID